MGFESKAKGFLSLFAGASSSRFTCKCTADSIRVESFFVSVDLPKFFGSENLDDAASAINDYTNQRDLDFFPYKIQFVSDTLHLLTTSKLKRRKRKDTLRFADFSRSVIIYSLGGKYLGDANECSPSHNLCLHLKWFKILFDHFMDILPYDYGLLPCFPLRCTTYFHLLVEPYDHVVQYIMGSTRFIWLSFSVVYNLFRGMHAPFRVNQCCNQFMARVVEICKEHVLLKASHENEAFKYQEMAGEIVQQPKNMKAKGL
ncbi:hypothetical protein SADUNF_Sadunf09G0005200 [Salix dunnii]|uniref:Uncharacterized protein n=1 Tax=Salix dunnii TaxID=1413687 RepID=A0A835JRK3_9ROSI|nr:hypothetical protein SADUNF_Sadunf09G0005200 [Salix dunnii]